MNNENINVQSGDEIAYGDWYDLWREELDKYQDDADIIYFIDDSSSSTYRCTVKYNRLVT